MVWYVTEAIEKERQRLDLSLGLRNSMWFFNNAPCPGIGSVFHPRLYTHSVLGIYIARELGLSPITVTNAIEALSVKLTFNATKDKKELVYRGNRAFGRNQDNLSFNFLKLAKNYVTITYRQNTSRYLTNSFGIGLVKSGSRYLKYELSDPALEILSGLNEGERKFRDILRNWVKDGNRQLCTWRWLTMPNTQPVEKKIYRELHNNPLPQTSFFKNFKDLRKHNCEYLTAGGDPSKAVESLDGEEKILFEASLKFLEIKDLLDIAIRKAGKVLEEHLHNSIKAESLKTEMMNLIKEKIKKHEELLQKLELTSDQKRFINDSRDLFTNLSRENNSVNFLCLLLDRAKDFFTVEPSGKYKRSLTYVRDNFNGELTQNTEIIPYSVRNLSSQLEFLA